ncbi:hypothetical protein DFH09DRAFT_1309596 [Mycena vulgaris]|nr:hypothetical protein DFH09DRAFT_1309596 [Mycena vulgaris]
MPSVPRNREKFDIAFGEGSKANGMVKQHARENYDKAINNVQGLELRINMETRWTPEDPEWQDAAALVSNYCYRHAVDNLEGLVVKRLLELTEVNQSGLAYKMRSHIAKALQVRSKAIRNALGRYNSAATAIVPHAEPEGNATIWAWADPLAHQLLDSYYKIQQAKKMMRDHR